MHFKYSVFTDKLQSDMACDVNFIIKGKGLFKVTGSHIPWKSGYILEMVLDRVVESTGH